MGGDGMGGLAVVILIVMAVMVATGFGVAFWLGKRFAHMRGWPPSRIRTTGLLAGFGGMLIGFAALVSTFYESSWSPPPRLEITVPPEYQRPWTIILEDPRAPVTLDWRGSSLPFAQRRAAVALPESGIVRVRRFGEASGRGDLEVSWSDGVPHNGTGGGPGPAGTRATAYMLLGRPLADGSLPEAPSGEALAAEVAARESH